ncbi:hypothetical protein [Neobacillus sp. D3-1R]|uniref:hypothetical protein n=1 Tax=Neobacillus sp. D3-1R TaxID=3445778 RepID=UPI003F9EE87A
MGHDIFGYNSAGKEVAYARFSMGNYNAAILYRLLDADHFHAGVSGSGDSATFSIPHMEKALNAFNQFYDSGSNFDSWDQKQIHDFIKSCLATAQKEGRVKVYFG